MKKLIALFLAMVLCLAAMSALADGMSSIEGDYGEVICRYANIRPGFKDSSRTVVRLNNGAQFEILSEKEDWYQLRYTDPGTGRVYEGWLWNAYAVKNPMHIVMDGPQVIRGCPMVSNLIVGTVDKNETYCIMGEYKDYYIINFREATGFILKDSDFHIPELEVEPTPEPVDPFAGGLG